MKGWADFLRAIASLLWPLILVGFGYAFRREIRALLRRLADVRKGKLFGQEFELDAKLDRLQEGTSKLESEIPIATPPAAADASFEQQILETTARSPKVALMLLSAELDRRTREILASSGWHQTISGSTSSAIDALARQGSLPASATASMKAFQEIRNRLVHGRDANEGDILRAIDSGNTLLKAIDSIPLEKNTVHRLGVALYSDPNCTQLIEDARGVVFETVSPGGVTTTYRIFPTTRTHFQLGRRVASEWNLDRVWGAAWYHDEETEDVKQAWLSSGEFIGRHLDDI